MSHGRGVEVWDVDGNRFLDFAAGIAVLLDRPLPSARRRGDQGGGRSTSCTSRSDYWHERQVRSASASPRSPRWASRR